MTRLRIVATLIAWLLLSVALWLSDADPSAIALLGVVAVSAAIGFVSFDLGTARQTILWQRPPESKPAAELRTEHIPRPLKDVHRAVLSHPSGLRSRLVALVDDRLMTRHGVDRRVAPANADAVLTQTLRKLVVNSRIDGTRELAAIIDGIEAL